jgi:hypothetical protein
MNDYRQHKTPTKIIGVCVVVAVVISIIQWAIGHGH